MTGAGDDAHEMGAQREDASADTGKETDADAGTGAGTDRGAGVDVVTMMPDHVHAVRTWRYGDPWSVYDGTDADDPSEENGYHAIVERRSGRFLGYVCVGAEARVPGAGEQAGVLDVGVGLDPSVVGRGRGRAIVGPALDRVAARHPGTKTMRAHVQAWNERSLRLCRSLGFAETGCHVADQDGAEVTYVVVERTLEPDGADGAEEP